MPKLEHARPEARTVQFYKIVYLFLFFSFPLKDPRDPKYLRQEMSKAGKRMWSEKEWILGLSQSKSPAQGHRWGKGPW